VVRVYLIFGLFLSLSVGCSSGTSSIERVSPTDSTQVVSGAIAMTRIPSIAISEVDITPTFVNPSIVANETTQEVSETPMPVTQSLTIIIVYDNNAYDQRLKTAWGFSALVEYHDHTLLFDTGGDGAILIENMRILGIDPTQIESVVLSHAHGDHTGGLNDLLEAGARPTVYLLPSFSLSFKDQIERVTQVVVVSSGQSIAEGLLTTGEMGRNILEQALVIRTEPGLVVITGCAHPGVIAILEQALEMYDEPIRLVLGGFHLGSKSKAEIVSVLEDFRRIGVEHVAPCHCTGAQAISMFAAEYGEDFIQAGVGRVVRLDIADR
jgi:7,8-dihydropterin-6-yl-methyl-4-(beta-D-ribofuranosyl)aminobenzene 5'-phosphate synthase